MILIIDNYDSFVYNLAHYTELQGMPCRVIRNDSMSIHEVEQLNPFALIISPGPCTPSQAGISVELIKKLGHKIPILGVCLGHQAIGEAYGGIVTHAQTPMHGKSCQIEHDGSGIFYNLPSPLEVGRYHSLIVKLNEKSPLKITASSHDDEIMALRHTSYPVHGVQFHPESILTPQGIEMIRNFMMLAKDWHTEQEIAA